MPTVGFESTISAGERPQTYALDRATQLLVTTPKYHQAGYSITGVLNGMAAVRINFVFITFQHLLVIIYKPFPKSTTVFDDNILLHMWK